MISQIVAPTDSELDKAKKLYDAVQALDNTDYSRKKTESEMKALNLKASKHAADVWKQKSGDSEDIALYLGLLRAAGLKAYAVKVVARNRGVFDPSYMYMGQLDDTIIDLHIGTDKMLLDPGEKMCPFGQLNWHHSGARGLAESDAGPSILSTPEQSYKDTSNARTATLTLDNHGGVTGTVQYTMLGQRALHWRQFALRNDIEELKKRFDKDGSQRCRCTS